MYRQTVSEKRKRSSIDCCVFFLWNYLIENPLKKRKKSDGVAFFGGICAVFVGRSLCVLRLPVEP